MFNLEWRINGRPVPSNRLADELTKTIKAEAIDETKKVIARVRCPVHGTGARNIRVHGNGDQVRFEFGPCCDRLEQAIAAKLR